MSETLLRQWEMLRAIPRWPAKVDVPSLVKHLARKHYRVSKRTVQRDLLLLSDLFPLLSDERGVTYGWSWSADAPAFDLPTNGIQEDVRLNSALWDLALARAA